MLVKNNFRLNNIDMPVIKYKGTDGEWHFLEDDVMEETIDVVQTSGTSSADVMSQSAVTEITSNINETIEEHTTDINVLEHQTMTTARALTDLDSRVTPITPHITDNSVHLNTTEKTNLDSLATNIGAISGFTEEDKLKLVTLNRRVRKDWTSSGFTWFKQTLKNAIADMSLEKYGMKVGDYITTSHTIDNSNITFDYIIAGFNIAKGNVEGYRLSADHIGIIVITSKTVPWNKGGRVSASTNHTLSTGGTWTTGSGACYANSDLHYYLTNTVLPHVKTDLGSDNIKSHTKYYTNAINTSGYNRFGTATGCASGRNSYQNQQICALSEIQIYGSVVWGSSGYDVGEACRQLDVFRVYTMNEIFDWKYPWLRDIASRTTACQASDQGQAAGDTTESKVSYNRPAVGLVIFA